MKLLFITVYIIWVLSQVLGVRINDRRNPIVEYRMNGPRAVYVHAKIYPRHLGTGARRNSRVARKVVALGKPGDHAGHIVAKVLGGNMAYYNLFPQNPRINLGKWKSEVETHMSKFLRQNRNNYIDFKVTLRYSGTSTRPTGLNFECRFYNGNRLVNARSIPMVGRHRVAANPYRGFMPNP